MYDAQSPSIDKDEYEMIDRIRQDIEQRLEQLLAEADKLRQALAELGSSGGVSARGSRRGRGAGGSRTGTGARSGGRGGARSTGTAGRAGSRGSGTTRGGGSSRARNTSGGTKNAVLEALQGAGGSPMTAGEVASATGLGRASVSTTLSKLARSGEVTKAARGYQVGGGAG